MQKMEAGSSTGIVELGYSMLYIMNERMDPAFNLSTEEYLVTIVREPTFMLWRNRPSVIIGRNQNPYRQVDAGFLERAEIPVLRRISGGGAVYHDRGNINFTIVRPTGKKLTLDCQTQLQPIIRFLRRMGLAAEFDGTNALSVEGKKISGNAQHIHKGMMLHHGTLLYDAALHTLSNALRTTAGAKYTDRSVDSVRQPVANLRTFMNRHLSVGEFMQRLFEYIQSENGGCRVLLSSADEAEIQKLAASKYRTWNWNFGHTPEYGFTHTTQLGRVIVNIKMQVRSGTIRQIEFTGKGLNDRFSRDLQHLLKGCRHRREEVADAIKRVDGQVFDNPATLSKLAEAFF
jgi:lipoate-protein ligase A